MIGKCNGSIKAYVGGLNQDFREANRVFHCNLGDNVTKFEKHNEIDDELDYRICLGQRGIIHKTLEIKYYLRL